MQSHRGTSCERPARFAKQERGNRQTIRFLIPDRLLPLIKLIIILQPPTKCRTILSALQSHRMNAPLLPFVFDALASLIVGNQVQA